MSELADANLGSAGGSIDSLGGSRPPLGQPPPPPISGQAPPPPPPSPPPLARSAPQQNQSLALAAHRVHTTILGLEEATNNLGQTQKRKQQVQAKLDTLGRQVKKGKNAVSQALEDAAEAKRKYDHAEICAMQTKNVPIELSASAHDNDSEPDAPETSATRSSQRLTTQAQRHFLEPVVYETGSGVAPRNVAMNLWDKIRPKCVRPLHTDPRRKTLISFSMVHGLRRIQEITAGCVLVCADGEHALVTSVHLHHDKQVIENDDVLPIDAVYLKMRYDIDSLQNDGVPHSRLLATNMRPGECFQTPEAFPPTKRSEVLHVGTIRYPDDIAVPPTIASFKNGGGGLSNPLEYWQTLETNHIFCCTGAFALHKLHDDYKDSGSPLDLLEETSRYRISLTKILWGPVRPHEVERDLDALSFSGGLPKKHDLLTSFEQAKKGIKNPGVNDTVCCEMLEGNAPGGSEWLPGKVLSVGDDKTFTVQIWEKGNKVSQQTYKFEQEGVEWKWPTKESPQACRNAEGVWIACQTIQQSIALGREAYLIEGVTRLLQEVRKWMTDHLSPKRLTQSATKNPTASSCSGFGSTTVQNLSIVPLYHLLAKHGLLEHVDISYKDETRPEIIPPDTEHQWTILDKKEVYRGRKLTNNKEIRPARVHAAIHTVRVQLCMLDTPAFQAALGLPTSNKKLVIDNVGSVWFTHNTVFGQYCAQDPEGCGCQISFKTCVVSGIPSITVSGNIGKHGLNGPQASHMEQVPAALQCASGGGSGGGGVGVVGVALSNAEFEVEGILRAQGSIVAHAQAFQDQSSP